MIFIGTVRDDGSRLDFDYPDDYRAHIKQFAGHEVEIEVRKRRSKRSLKQNAAYHAAIAPLAEHLGYTTEELKLAMLGGCFGWREIAGQNIPERLHTSDLNTQDFNDLMAYTMQIAAEHDVLILDPSEWKAAKKKAQKKALNGALRSSAALNA